ncbi:glycosyltransferase [Thiorhodococcus mannitoliphagus]|uniref:Glycosyltransferase n=1 Tax=Thiorhodococcus mannitoliphagus TaxID=329406 RepID=A0A6P1DY90_9GAMM|nr:glycosyltransferase [Thiorhodococcus mannitoliphagus]NEX23287.1 glycosyltransferase [Thiorhodococcus mannitoliphagus]
MFVTKTSDLRVLHVIPSLHPGLGGPSVSCPSLASAQAELCASVGLLAYDLSESALNRLTLPNWDRVHLHSIAVDPLERLTGIRARQVINSLLGCYDVVHIHGVWTPMLAQVCRAARDSGLPYVVSPRGMLDPWSLAQKPVRKRLSFALAWADILTHAHFLHALTEIEAENLSRLRLGVRIQIAQNGIFRETILRLRSMPGSEYSARYGRYILFMSRLHYKKGLDYLIDGFAEYVRLGGECNLVIAGPDEGQGQKISAQVRCLALHNRIISIGPIYGDEKFRLLNGAQAFCLPSRQEGFSMAVIEAMAMGVPVVISKHCNFPRVAEMKAGYVVELDPVEIGQALLAAADSNSKTGDRGARLIESEYSWDSVAPKLLSAYL